MAAPVVTYTPEPFERPYYEALFAAADTQRTGNIGGAQAVQFFQLSKLPVDALKNIWTLADQNPTNSFLDKRKFGVAIRLIQLQQNGQKAQGANLAAPPGVVLRPAMFEGVSGVTAPLPPTPGAAPQPARPATPQQQMPPAQPQTQQPMRAATPTQQMQPAVAPSSPPQQPSMALTTQDPYAMLPHDVSRYETLFPQYDTNKDGYVYGKEAVDLFSKSGLEQDQLRLIWNMVDQPVDNRLDKLEFSMAMHLIVCISMKKLPMPQALPYSLKIMKQQQQQPAMQQAPAYEAGMVAPPSPGRPPLHPPQPGQPSPAMSGMAPPASSADSVGGGSMGAGSMSGLPGPPPIVQGGTASISDAFEGLSTTPQQSFDAPPPVMPSMDHASPPSIPEPERSMPEPAAMSLPEPAAMAAAATATAAVAAAASPAPAPVQAPPRDTKELAASYAMGDDHEELDKLKVTLQKLQAENISLKAQLGSMTEEEKEVHKEISATVAEIGTLCNDLTDLRAQVLSAKSSLLEATAELNKQREKKDSVNDRIGEAKSTKDALDAANEAIADINSSQHARAAPAPAANHDADLFSWGDDAPAPAPAAAYDMAPAPAVANDMAPAPAVANDMAPVAQPEIEKTAPVDVDIPPPPPAGEPPASPGGFGGGMPSPGGFGGAPLGGSAGDLAGSASSFQAPSQFATIPQPVTVETVTSAPSQEEIDGLKQKLSEAESTANDAERQRLALAEKADVLRREAEQAEQAAKEKDAAAHQTPKRRFARGKKKELKQAEQLLQEASDKKRQFMEAQAAAQHASQVAMETKFEADKIRKDAETAELNAVKNASMMDSQQQSNPAMPTSSYPPMEKQPEVQHDFGNGGTMGGYDGSFGSGVMGGGGLSIPTPSAADTANDHGGWGNVLGMGAAAGGGDMGGIPTPPQSAAGDGHDPYANPF